jgi:hypothetical protein
MTARFLASESATVFSLVSKVVTTLLLLSLLIDCADMDTDYIAQVNE